MRKTIVTLLITLVAIPLFAGITRVRTLPYKCGIGYIQKNDYFRGAFLDFSLSDYPAFEMNKSMEFASLNAAFINKESGDNDFTIAASLADIDFYEKTLFNDKIFLSTGFLLLEYEKNLLFDEYMNWLEARVHYGTKLIINSRSKIVPAMKLFAGWASTSPGETLQNNFSWYNSKQSASLYGYSVNLFMVHENVGSLSLDIGRKYFSPEGKESSDWIYINGEINFFIQNLIFKRSLFCPYLKYQENVFPALNGAEDTKIRFFSFGVRLFFKDGIIKY